MSVGGSLAFCVGSTVETSTIQQQQHEHRHGQQQQQAFQSARLGCARAAAASRGVSVARGGGEKF